MFPTYLLTTYLYIISISQLALYPADEPNVTLSAEQGTKHFAYHLATHRAYTVCARLIRVPHSYQATHM